MKNKTIQNKILLYLLGFCAMLLVILWLFQIAFLDTFYKNIKISQIKQSAKSIEQNIDSLEISQYIQNIGHGNDTSTEIINIKGQLIYSYTTDSNFFLNQLTVLDKLFLYKKTIEAGGELTLYVEGNDLVDKQITEYKRYSMGDVQIQESKTIPPQIENTSNIPKIPESIVYTKQIRDSKGQDLLIIMNTEITPVNATVSTLRIQLYAITAIMIILSSILAYLISKKISKPIQDLNISAHSLAKGNYNTNFKATGYKEIEELSNTLNLTAMQLSKVESLRKELMANVSHDLRTPLTLITGYAEAMIDLPDELNQENVQTIMTEAQRLNTLVNEILDMTKINKENLNIQELNITEHIKSIVDTMQELTKTDGYIIKFEPQKQIKINSDPTRVSQVFQNLLINAINHTGQDKTITITQTITKKDNIPYVYINIQDTGKGIDQTEIPYIWERYYKGKNKSSKYKGSGLGLSIVKTTMEALEGDYGCTSELGKGSTFYIGFPIKK